MNPADLSSTLEYDNANVNNTIEQWKKFKLMWAEISWSYFNKKNNTLFITYNGHEVLA